MSGALLAFQRRAWEELGGFDEGYRLYFEETDWLERLRRRGLPASFVPGAEAVHLYAQSTAGEPRAGRWFADSHRRFRRRFYGRAFTALLELLGRVWRPAAALVPERQEGRSAWLEVSASPLGFPAAGRRLGETVSESVPEEILDRLAPGTYHLRTVDADGGELACRVLER